MKQLTVLLLCHQILAQIFDTDNNCFIDNRSLENMWDQKLAQHLYNCHDLYKPPPTNESAPLKVNIFFTLNSFRLIGQAFTVHGWTFVKWHDSRLEWDPSQFGGLNKIEMPSFRIWVPGIKHINSIEGTTYDIRQWYIPFCDVTSNGRVKCATWTKYSSPCRPNIKEWPNDAQNCTLKFGILPETGTRLTLHRKSGFLMEVGTEYGTGWEFMGYMRGLKRDSGDEHLALTLILRRHANLLAIVLLYPSFVLSTLTLSGLFIDARRKTRLLVLCFSLMCQFNFLSELAENIPKHTREAPGVLLFYRGSFIMTSVLIGVSFLLYLVCTKERPCPNWIISVNDFVYGNFVKFTVWPRWETKSEDGEICEYLRNWINFANIFNSMLIVISVIVYLLMFVYYIPRPYKS